MALLLDDASNEHFATAVEWQLVIAAPFTLFAWGRSDVTNINQALISIGDTGTANNYWQMYFSNAGTAGIFVNAGGITDFTLTGTVVANTWHSLGVVLASSTSRTPYFDGTAGGTSVNDRAPSGVNELRIGMRVRNNSTTDGFSGQISEPAVWDIDLTADEMFALADRISPDQIRSAHRVFYRDFIRDFNRPLQQGTELTEVNGSTVADHVPGIIYAATPQHNRSPVLSSGRIEQVRVPRWQGG